MKKSAACLHHIEVSCFLQHTRVSCLFTSWGNRLVVDQFVYIWMESAVCLHHQRFVHGSTNISWPRREAQATADCVSCLSVSAVCLLCALNQVMTHAEYTKECWGMSTDVLSDFLKNSWIAPRAMLSSHTTAILDQSLLEAMLLLLEDNPRGLVAFHRKINFEWVFF